MKKVNATQLKKIEEFLIKKDIIYTDLQMEFLDHICSGIEEQWEKDEQLSFDKAFHNEYKNFGIFGFSDIMEKREGDLKWYYWKQIGIHGLTWLKLPQIFFTLLLGYGIHLVLNTSYNHVFINILFGTIVILTTYQSIRLKLQERKNKKEGKQVLLMDKVIQETQTSSFIIYSPYLQFIFSNDTLLFSTITNIVFSCIFTILVLIYYHIIYDFPKNKTKYFRHNYTIA